MLRGGSVGLVPPLELWDEVIAPRLDELMGEVFERVCREHVRAGRAPIRPLRLGSWWDGRSRHQVDVAAVSADGSLFAAECKWGEIRARDLESLRERSRRVAAELPRAGPIHLGFYSGRGAFDDAVREAAARGEATLYGPDDVAGAPD